MKKSTKIWLIAAGALILVGLAVFIGAMAALDWSFGGIGGSGKYVTNTYEITDGFKNIAIASDTDDIAFEPSGDKGCRVICCESEDMKHTVRVNNKTLEIIA